MLFGQGMTGYRHVIDKDLFMKFQHQTSVALSYLGQITSQTKSYDVIYEVTGFLRNFNKEENWEFTQPPKVALDHDMDIPPPSPRGGGV